MLKAIQCDSCGSAMTVTKMPEMQQVACPQCHYVLTVAPSPIDKNTIIGNRYQLKERFEENQYAQCESKTTNNLKVQSRDKFNLIENFSDFSSQVNHFVRLSEETFCTAFKEVSCFAFSHITT